MAVKIASSASAPKSPLTGDESTAQATERPSTPRYIHASPWSCRAPPCAHPSSPALSTNRTKSGIEAANPAAPPHCRTAAVALNPVRAIPKGANTRSRTNASYVCPLTFSTIAPSSKAPTFEYCRRDPGAKSKGCPAITRKTSPVDRPVRIAATTTSSSRPVAVRSHPPECSIRSRTVIVSKRPSRRHGTNSGTIAQAGSSNRSRPSRTKIIAAATVIGFVQLAIGNTASTDARPKPRDATNFPSRTIASAPPETPYFAKTPANARSAAAPSPPSGKIPAKTGKQKLTMANRLRRIGERLFMRLLSSYRLVPVFTLALSLWAQSPRRVIVDTDAGTDDLLALLFLLQRTDIQIEAITTVHGLANPAAGAETVSRLLAFSSRPNIPVFIGATRPLEGSAAFPADWRAAADRLLRQLPVSPVPPQNEPAPAFLKRRLLQGPPVDILALGPLTNFALALRDEPRLGFAIREFTWMGGALRVPGNVPAAPDAEWNAYLDPIALERVLATGWKLRFVGLDASTQVPVTMADLDRMETLRLNPATWLAVELLRTEAASIAKGQYYAWDPLAAAILVAPSLAQFENVAIDVRKRSSQRGRLIRVPAVKPNVTFATSADANKFKRLFWSVLLM